MKLPTELLLLLYLSIFQTTGAAPAHPQSLDLQRRSTSFRSLRGLTTLSHDYSTAESFSHPTKFFHESTFSTHYDGRFADVELPHSTRTQHLRLLLKSYMETMERIGVRTWLMHGCLLGWWWNGKIMPWDTDVDVMVDEKGIAELGSWWNMSVHHFTADDLKSPDLWKPGSESAGRREYEAGDEQASQRMLQEEVTRGGKKYLLEVNPHYANTSTRDKENVIDARWIDTTTGLFIDITTVHVQPIPVRPYDPEGIDDKDEEGEDLELYTKDQHAYSYSQMFPLRTSTLEGLKVHIPYAYEEVLLDEYGPKAITYKWYRGWKFDDERHEWAQTSDAQEIPSTSEQHRLREGKSGKPKKYTDEQVYKTTGRERAAAGKADLNV